MEILSTTPAADVTAPNQLLWTFDTLPITSEAKFFVNLLTPDTTAVGLPINLKIEAALAGDAAPDDNTINVVSEVIAAYDPNNKLVFPSSVLKPDLDSALLYYTIRFQNTGNAAATFVILRDTYWPVSTRRRCRFCAPVMLTPGVCTANIFLRCVSTASICLTEQPTYKAVRVL